MRLDTTSWSEFKRGVRHFIDGYRFLNRNRRLWIYALPIVLAYMPIFFIYLIYFPLLLKTSIAWIVASLTPLWGVWIGKILIILGALLIVLPIGLILILVMGILLVLATILASFFNDFISRGTEKTVAGQVEITPFSIRGMLREYRILVVEEVKKMGFYLGVQAVLFIVGFIPFIGPVIFFGVGGVFTVFFLAFEYIDYPMSRRLMPLRQKLSLLLKRRWLVMGFGLVSTALLLIPVLNAFVMAYMVVGATLLYLDIAKDAGL